MIHFVDRILLATTEAGLPKGSVVYALNLPMPSLPIYSDHSAKVTLSDGGQALRGFSSVSLTWNFLDWDQARILRELGEDSLDSADGLIYAKVNRAWNRSGSGEDWIDISGRPHIFDGTSASGTFAKISDNVTLLIGNHTIVNDPSSY